MDISPLRLARLLAPRVPLILKTFILSKLSMSANSDKQDTQTEVFVIVLRSILSGPPRPLKVIQDGSVKDTTIKGKMWIAKVHVEASGTDIRDAVLGAIAHLGNGSEKFDLPDVADIPAEWTGYRNCQKNEARMQISERGQYEHMMKEVTSDATVLYFHGGAYFLMSPASHRKLTSEIAGKIGGRSFSVQYRLAPQSAFPAQLLDGFLAYLYLLSPPDGSFHEPIAPQNIVLAGDSAGGNLSCALLLLLITLQKQGVKSVTYHGKQVPIELPAGVAVNSPWTDISRSLPTIHSNAKYDYLDPPSATGLPTNPMPPDEIWPAKPPRAEIFCTASILTHPLASPVLATPDMWKGMPPVFMCCGNEGLEDEIKVTARQMYLSGGSVEFAGYEGMPHCFAMMFPTTVVGKDCFGKWTQFISDAVKGQVQRKDTGQWLKALSNPPTFQEVSLADIGIPDEEVQKRIHRMKDFAVEREQEALKKWEQDVKAKL